MSNKKKAEKDPEPVKIRFKKLSNGDKSILLAFWNGTKWEYETLKHLRILNGEANKTANNNTLREAREIRRQRIEEIKNAEYGLKINTRGKMKVYDYIETIADKHKEEHGKRGKYLKYKTLLHHLGEYNGKETSFKQVDKNYCLGFIEYLKTAKNKTAGDSLGTNTQIAYISQFISILNDAITEGIITVNPFNQIKSGIRPKKKESDREYLTYDEVQTLISTPYEVLPIIKNAFLFSCFTGLRFSDVTTIRWGQLQTDNNGNTSLKYIQKKTKKLEYLPLTKEIVNFLPQQGNAKESDYIFKLYTNVYVNLHLKNWIQVAGINKHVTWHVARHTYATMLLNFDVSIETVGSMLGHSNLRTTQIYAKIIDKSKREAVNKLDVLFKN
jgi:integrase